MTTVSNSLSLKKEVDASRIIIKQQRDKIESLEKELEQYQTAKEDGRLVVLPARKELGERLCDFCDYPDEKKGTHLGPNGPYGCEGSWCEDAYDKFLDEAEDLTGVQVGEGEQK